ncbi:M50 family metallopeptidase [Herbiconiux sp. SYSU D00978]|uniref:M50 family metallopeptidase n=1 Tax=Herbiconiux sp. SYSU D00978 TaxID=2812562 RepID=UPI001A96D56C|nr:M50 family metallopeptidase [Herbiconiux sp. SYSU D00978]
MEAALLYVLGIVVVLIGVIVSIGLHEIGHLVPAKLFGVRVGQYMIGFGRTLFSFRRGETEYGLKAIPLGGYISMAGMYPPAKAGGKARTASTGFFQTLVQDARTASAETVPEGEEARTFYRLPVLKRIVVMLGGPVMNLLIGVVLYAVVLCLFGIQTPSTTIGNVQECVLPATSERQTCQSGDTEAPGNAAGLLPGDRIEAIDGTAITSWNQATALIRESAGDPLEFTIVREGETTDATVTPLLSERYVTDSSGALVEDASGAPVTQQVGFVGIGPAYEIVRQPASEVLPAVGDNIVRVAGIVLTLPERLVDIAQAAFGTEERDPEGPMSIVGVGRIAGEITSLDTIPIVERISYLLGLLASLNIALFVFNLIPLLPLDGGHVAGAVIEGVRRFFAKLFRRPDPGPVDTAKIIPITFAVVLLFGGMSLLLIYADIVNPVSIL